MQEKRAELTFDPRRETEIGEPVTPILIAGLPGKMATLVAEEIARSERYDLLPFAMSSKRHNREAVQFGDQKVRLNDYIPSDIRERTGAIAVDYTAFRSAASNAFDYTLWGLPFIMGTTGGNTQEFVIEEMVRHSEIPAVIAPNMHSQIVERQMEIEDMATTTPGIFEGATVKIIEIHQPSKVNTDGTPSVSGTATAFRAQYEDFGALPGGDIESIRNPNDPRVQEAFGFLPDPEKGYAYHRFVVMGRNGSIIHEFETRAIGRQSYVSGTLMAMDFLTQRMREGSKGEVFSMSDVIRSSRRAT